MKKLIVIFLFLLPISAFADAFDDAVTKYESDVKKATEVLNSKITNNTNLVKLVNEQASDDVKSNIRTEKKKHNKQLSQQEKSDEQKFEEKKQQENASETITPNKQNTEQISELEANAQAMKDKETSTQNKTLGAVSMGATGIGGSKLLQGLAEQSVDTKSENDMKGYMATFKCDYGQGQNVNGGEKEVVLPGANVLAPMYTEYKTLATDLKNTKTALGMTPGIESETIFDKATTGLYDNKSLGKNSGAFASVSDAIAGGAGAAAWNAQKAESANLVSTGMVVAGGGIAAGLIGNMALNKNSPTENSDAINAKYAKIAASAKEIQTEIDNKSTTDKLDCGTDANEVNKECICNDTNKIYTEGNCVNKPTVDTYCGTDERAFVTTNNKCACSFGFDFMDNKCVCSSPKEIDGMFCKIKEVKKIDLISNNQFKPTLISSGNIEDNIVKAEPEIIKIGKITLKSNSFAPNEYQVREDYKNILLSKLDNISSPDVCYNISGNTDRTGTEQANKDLSLKRAENVRKILTDKGIPSDHITTVGNGWTNCTSTGSVKSVDACRNVTLEIDSGSCRG